MAGQHYFGDLRVPWGALDNTFVKDVGLAAFLPIYPNIAGNVMQSLANSLSASGTMIYPKK
ncbi:MAG: hypothetical protein WB952_15680 [Terriglobales bacterium]|jgi:hypothetical protein